MTLDDYSRLNRYKRLNTVYKRLSIVLVFAILYLLFPSTSDAASCWQDRGSYYHTTYQANFQGLTDDAGTVDSCTGVILMTAQEYAKLKAESEFALESNSFDSEMYDLGIEGVIKLFVAGLGIGAILAMLNKIRR